MEETQIGSERNADAGEGVTCEGNAEQRTTHEHNSEGTYAGEWISIMEKLGLSKSPFDLERDDMIGKLFPSIEAAKTFYYLYGRLVGFSVRKGHMRKKGDGRVRYRTWLCYKQGVRHTKHLNRSDRKREPKLISRERCGVQFRISYNKKHNKWIVREFMTQHTHAVALRCQATYLRSFRKISEATKTKVKGMHRSGLKTAKILSYMAQLAGGYDKLGIWPRDLQNCLQMEEPCNLSTYDAAATIGYLQHKAEHDVGFFAKYSYDEEKRLLNLFWSDSRCQQAYSNFGDSIAFDTTYKCNKFKNPVTILVGVNHHGSTSIFGFALLADETLETYVWVLETFLECMRGKLPATVVTDGDLAMKSAIAKVMNGTIHRLCSWHLTQNAISNVKDPGFLPWLQMMMKRQYDDNIFDSIWCKGVADFGLQENAWVKSLYDRRKSWADTYLRGHFFAGMLTTQRCEGMHAYLKSKVDKRISLVDFMRSFDLALSWLRMKESKNDFESREYRPVVGRTVLPAIEAEVATCYTNQMFLKVRNEMSKEGTYYATNVDEIEDTIVVKLLKYGNASKVKVVTKSIATNTFYCECNKFPSEGIPCRHIFASMKTLQITTMPRSLLMKRWMKNEKAGRQIFGDGTSGGSCNLSCKDQGSRFGQLMAKTTELAYYASLSDTMHAYAVTEIDRLTGILQGMSNRSGNDNMAKENSYNRLPDIKNPSLKRTKGAPATNGNKTLRVCSNCRKPGHNKATCKRKHFDGNTPCSSQDRQGNESMHMDNSIGEKEDGLMGRMWTEKEMLDVNRSGCQHGDDSTSFATDCARPSTDISPSKNPPCYNTGRVGTINKESYLDEYDFFIGQPYGD